MTTNREARRPRLGTGVLLGLNRGTNDRACRDRRGGRVEARTSQLDEQRLELPYGNDPIVRDYEVDEVVTDRVKRLKFGP